MRYYGNNKVPEDVEKCAVEIKNWQGCIGNLTNEFADKRQCSYKRGYGVIDGCVVKGGIYCRKHAREVAVGRFPAFGVPEEDE